VEAWRGSGLNQSAFCRREGLGLAVFGGWKRLLERKSGGTRTAQQAGESVAETFVPVKVSAESSKGSAARPSGILELELRNGRVLRFPSSLVPDDLAGWAAALETRPC
jgi:hypothetical protein